jgi:hypothetical protein
MSKLAFDWEGWARDRIAKCPPGEYREGKYDAYREFRPLVEWAKKQICRNPNCDGEGNELGCSHNCGHDVREQCSTPVKTGGKCAWCEGRRKALDAGVEEV